VTRERCGNWRERGKRIIGECECDAGGHVYAVLGENCSGTACDCLPGVVMAVVPFSAQTNEERARPHAAGIDGDGRDKNVWVAADDARAGAG
jgi:hypothetical protein